MSTPSRIKKLQQQRQVLMTELLKTQAMIRGSFGTAYRKCGHSNCWCAHGDGHPVDRINFSDEGRSRTKAVKAADVQWAKQMTENYKQFRKNRQALRALDKKINLAIDELEAKLVDRTARQRNYEI
ncbi:MAG: DUF6788 family protein [Pseudomonadales bacterium]